MVNKKTDKQEKEPIIGKKSDAGKPAWDCIPLPLIEGIARTMAYGKKKYNESAGTKNWMHVEDGEYRYYASMMRHMCEYQKGNFVDPESGLLHIDHFLFNAMAYAHFANTNSYKIASEMFGDLKVVDATPKKKSKVKTSTNKEDNSEYIG